ncbi:uncharacterized protein LOC142239572 [Haematobia irritans]|uniref:uncharacterized protein LOC142239572 n=1 Tax=Haematobia irritans TaxID=7368 RepID=UPI003F4F67AD
MADIECVCEMRWPAKVANVLEQIYCLAYTVEDKCPSQLCVQQSVMYTSFSSSKATFDLISNELNPLKENFDRYKDMFNNATCLENFVHSPVDSIRKRKKPSEVNNAIIQNADQSPTVQHNSVPSINVLEPNETAANNNNNNNNSNRFQFLTSVPPATPSNQTSITPSGQTSFFSPSTTPVDSNTAPQLRVDAPKKTIFASRFAEDTSPEEISSYIKWKLRKHIDTEVYKFKYAEKRRAASFKILVPEEDFATVVNPEFWPARAIIHEFIYRENPRNELSKKTGGGVLIAVSAEFPSEQIILTNIHNMEILAVKIRINSYNIFLTCSYIPPNSCSNLYENHISAILSAFSSSKSSDFLLAFGDFNLPSISWNQFGDTNAFIPISSNDTVIKIIQPLLDYGLFQINNVFNSQKRILDLVFVNQPSDYCINPCDSITFPVDKFHPSFRTQCVPKKVIVKSFGPPWNNRNLARLKNKKNKLFKKYKRSGSSSDFTLYVIVRSEFNVENLKAYRIYTTSMKQQLKSNPKSFYKFINSKRRTSTLPNSLKNDTSLAENDVDISNMFADFFASTYSDVKYDCESEYPFNIIEFPTSGNRFKVSNYRGIAKLSAIPKLLEKMVTEFITHQVSSALNECQHGFRKSRSTITNILELTTLVNDGFRMGKQTDVIYTDFSKAFDKVNHMLLLRKLQQLGFSSSLLKWISSYLIGRIQRVRFRNVFSNQFDVISGVPQGSHLGPVLFTIFINDLPFVIKNAHVLMYADDVKIFYSFNDPIDQTLLQSDLDNFLGWCDINLMKLNISKCKHMSFYRVKRIDTSYFLYSRELDRVETFLDLGILLDNRLNFKQHLTMMINKAYSSLGFMKRWCKEFDDHCVTKTIEELKKKEK